MILQDLVAAYAAVLSTFVAAVQFSDWRHKRQFLAVSTQEAFGDDSSQWEILISNRGSHPVRLMFVAYGTCKRYWRVGFRYIPDSLHSVSDFIRDQRNSDLDRTGAVVDGRTLMPGETVEVVVQYADEEILQRMHIPELRLAKKRCIWIEHSQSEHPVVKIITPPTKEDAKS